MFSDIQDKINRADIDDTIYLDGKTYTGEGSQINVTKSITIDGSNGFDDSKTILDANNTSRVFYINAFNVVLKNIIFKNVNNGGNGACICLIGGNLTADNLIIADLNVSTTASIYGAAIYAATNTNIHLNHITLTNNTVKSTNFIRGGLICFRSSSSSVISDLNVYNNTILSTGNYVHGGIIFIDQRSNFQINKFISSNNSFFSYQRMYGANICFFGSRLDIKNILISKNYAESLYPFHPLHDIDSIGILSYYQSVNIVDNYTFTNNVIFNKDPSHPTGGGAFFVNDVNSFTNVTNSYVYDNKIYHNYNIPQNPLLPTLFPVQALYRLSGSGNVINVTFDKNYVNEGIAALQLVPTKKTPIFLVDSCNFYNNFVETSSKNSNRTYFADHGAAICVSGGYGGNSIIRNCSFINNTNSQGGAITPHNNCIVENCTFINNTATKFYGGAISTEDGLDINNANIVIRNCYFKANSAPIGGAIQAKGDNVDIYDCIFVDNVAVQGGAVFLEGNNLFVGNCTFRNNNASHNIDSRIMTNMSYLPQVQIWNAYGGAVYIHGNNAILNNNKFLYNYAIHENDDVESKGGAVYIYGDNATIFSSYFDDNFAHSGNGSAIYVLGINTTVTNSKFYNHDSGRGTVFIRGSFADILNSIFKSNTAFRGGAGVYSIGNYSLVDNCTFEDNNATIHGGAIHSHGDYIRILNSKFISNNTHPSEDILTNGLGGAIFSEGDFNDIAFCEFEFNTARNGSAIYNRGSNLTIEDCNFHFNQAYSYNLFIFADPVISNYTKNNKIIVNITHIGGDNIINAIYNDGNYKNIFFLNVTYEHSSIAGGKRNTGLTKVNPVKSADESNGGQLVYQDPREDLQIINLILTHENEANDLLGVPIQGDIIQQHTGRTGLYGNITFALTGDLKPGKYNIYASHPDDRLYKGIKNLTSFEVLPHVDLKITKNSDKDTYFVGDTATFTITVTSMGTDAHNVTVKEILPDSFEIIDFKVSKGTFKNNVWSGFNVLQEISEILTLKVKLTKTGIFTNIVNVTTSNNDTNLSNNIANKTINVINYVDLKVTKTANVKEVKIGDKIVWKITITNHGTINATGVKVTDKFSKSLKYLSHSLSKGTFNPENGIWDIRELGINETATLILITKAIKLGKITNIVKVTSNEIDVNVTNNKANFTVKVKLNNTEKENSKLYSNKFTISNDESRATGNPVLLLILSLMSAYILFRRKN